MYLIDTHIHLDDDRYIDRKSDLVIARERQIGTWIVPATTVERFPAVKAVAASDNHIYAAYGLHPYFMEQHKEEDLDHLEEWIIREKPVAIGECGLDTMIENPQLEKQQLLFEAQVALAKKYDLPLIIHARKTLDLILKEIRRHQGALRGVIHGFSGSLQQAEQVIEQGFYLGFGGAFTYDRATRLQSILRTIQSSHYLLETDGPYQPSSSLERGALHLPQDLIYIAKKAAQIREESLAEIIATSYNNSHQLFNISMNERE